jgi:cation:H+ antiporter
MSSLILLGIPIGLVFLYYGSEWMVDGAKKMAFRMGVTPFVVGLTVVAFGSSAPEAVTSLVSGNNPQIIIGNIVGSNTANIGLAIGLAAIISPVVCKYKEIRFELVTMMISIFVITLLALNGYYNWIIGLFLIACLFAFVYSVYVFKAKGRKDAPVEDKELAEESKDTSTPIWKSSIMVVLGILVLYVGAKVFIAGSVELAGIIGISDLLVGLLVVAVGTSLPELCICLLAAYRHENELVVSNIVGSIIFNSFFALGIGALVANVPITHYMLVFHMPVMILMGALMFIMIKSKDRISRPSGFLLFGIYAAYVALMAIFPELTSGVM